MRNLKRALSLALASVMVLGMMVVGTSAAGYKDVSSEQNQEAIEVLQAVGIMTGDENGNFNPDAKVTRNEMAVIMSNLLNLDYDYYRGINKFTDVPEWAAPYVAACVAEGVTAGIGNNQYGGSNNVTAAQASLMIMKALGYFQYAEDFGEDWQVATIRQASYIGLFSGVKANAETPLTRNQVAQLVLNGLKANMVDFTGDVGSKVTLNGVEINIGYKAEYTDRTNADKKYNSIDSGITNIAANDQYYVQLGEELYDGDLTLKGSDDEFMRPANTWRYDGKDIGTYAEDPDLTYTKKAKSGDIYSDLGLSKAIAKADVTVYVDGIEKDALAYAIKKGDDDNGFGANGVLTQVYYDDDNNSVIITEINTYVGTVVKNVKATSKDDAYVLINPETVNPGIGNTKFETEEVFDTDAYVLYTYSQKEEEIESVKLAEEITGVVTKSENTNSNNTDKKALTIEGTRYTASANVTGENLGDVSVDEEYTICLDAYGYLIYVERIDEIGDYALLYATDLGGIFNSNKALLVFADGTSKIVTTAKDYSDATKLNYDYNGDGTIDGTDKTAWSGAAAAAKPVIVTYRQEDDGDYTLRAVKGYTSANVRVSEDELVMVNDKAGIKIDSSTTVTSNSATTIVVRDPDNAGVRAGDDWISYTGIKSAPSISTSSATDDKADVYYYCKTGSMVTVMFVVPEKDVIVEDGVNKALFLSQESVSNLIHDKDGDYYEYDAVVNGEIQKGIKVSADVTVDGVKVGETAAKNLGNALYNRYSTDSKGIITRLVSYVGPYVDGATNSLASGVGIDKVSKEYTVIINCAKKADGTYLGTPYTITVDEDADIFYVNKDGDISESSYNGIAIDNNDLVWAVVDDYLVQTLVIFEVKGDDLYVQSNDASISGLTVKGVAATKTGATTYEVSLSDDELKDATTASMVVEGIASGATLVKNEYYDGTSWNTWTKASDKKDMSTNSLWTGGSLQLRTTIKAEDGVTTKTYTVTVKYVATYTLAIQASGGEAYVSINGATPIQVSSTQINLDNVKANERVTIKITEVQAGKTAGTVTATNAKVWGDNGVFTVDSFTGNSVITVPVS